MILLARSDGDLRELAAQIQKQHGGPDAEVIAADLAAPDGPQRILRELRDRGLTVDLRLNNAGAGSVGLSLGRPLEPRLRSIGLNINGLLALTHTIGAELVARGSGGISNVSSTASFQPMPYQASYAATKAFVLSFTEALAEELRGTGVPEQAVPRLGYQVRSGGTGLRRRSGQPGGAGDLHTVAQFVWNGHHWGSLIASMSRPLSSNTSHHLCYAGA